MRPALSLSLAGIAAAMALCALPAGAASLYKWVDANGRVVYSDQPPTAPNIKAEKLNAAASPGDPSALKDLAQKDADLKKRAADRDEAYAKSGKDRVQKQKQAEDCARTASALTQLSWSQIVIYRANEKGEDIAMTEADRAKEKARLEAYQKEHCS
jgi:hypothetical protein